MKQSLIFQILLILLGYFKNKYHFVLWKFAAATTILY